MKPQGHIRHQVDGRVRIAVPQHRGDRAYFDKLGKQLGSVGPVRAVHTNALTGSVVLKYVGELDQVLKQLDGADLIDVAPQAATRHSHMNGQARPVLQAGPMLLVGAFFSAVGVVQSLRGELALPAMSAFWYALNAFRVAASEVNASDRT
jgi:hypothetical protein